MSSVATVVDLLGGEPALGRQVTSSRDLVALVRSGLPTRAVDELLRQKVVSLAELDRVVMPRRTLASRRQSRRLTREQSDRLVRLTRIIALACETFGDGAKAGAWLRRPTRPLGDQAPLDLLDTDQGAREVEDLIGRIAHGIAA